MTDIITAEQVLEEYPIVPTDTIYPKVVILMFGDNPASDTYVRNKVRLCTKHGINAIVHHIAINSEDYYDDWLNNALKIIDNANNDSTVRGIMVQLPLPVSYKSFERQIVNAINPNKDIDGLTDVQAGRLLHANIDIPSFKEGLYIPATVRGIMHILDYIKEDRKDYCGMRAVVLGRSDIVGRPMSIVLDKYYNMTVTVLHSHSEDTVVNDALSKADLVISAVGNPEFIKGSMLKKGAIVIDAGTTYVDKNGKRVLVGDVDFDSACPLCSAITPVPKGVGPCTVHALVENIFDADVYNYMLETE